MTDEDDFDFDTDPAELPPAEQQTVSADDPDTERKRKTRIQREYDEAANFWKSVLGTEIGRRQVWQLLTDSRAFEISFACGPNGFPQSEATWFKAGETSFGQRFWLTLQRFDVDAVLLMHRENDKRLGKPPNVPRRKVT